MKKSEFDKFADEYSALHKANVRLSGESPDYFAEYKIRDMVTALADQSTPRAILDFGGGIGTSVPYVNRFFPEANLICLDVSARSLGVASVRYAGLADFVLSNGITIPFEDGCFDLAFAACVYHHIDLNDHTRSLKECYRVVRPGGSFFLFEHNPYNPLTQFAVNTCPFDENAVLIAGRLMAKRFRAVGFDDVKLRYRLFFPKALSFMRTLEPLLTWFPLGAQYYVWGHKDKCL